MSKKSAKANRVDADPASAPQVTKAEAARAAIEAGYAIPNEAVAWIKSRYDLDMSPSHFSAVKSSEKKRIEPAKKSRNAQPKAAVEGYLAPPPSKKPGEVGDLIDSLETLKPLVAQYGSEKLKRLVDLLG